MDLPFSFLSTFFLIFSPQNKRMKLYKLLFAFYITLTLFSCKKNEDASENGISVAPKTILNVPYGDNAMQKMDIY